VRGLKLQLPVACRETAEKDVKMAEGDAKMVDKDGKKGAATNGVAAAGH
jgi:hypothetical protein